jgi:hypothetical protein
MQRDGRCGSRGVRGSGVKEGEGGVRRPRAAGRRPQARPRMLTPAPARLAPQVDCDAVAKAGASFPECECKADFMRRPPSQCFAGDPVHARMRMNHQVGGVRGVFWGGA